MTNLVICEMVARKVISIEAALELRRTLKAHAKAQRAAAKAKKA